MYDVIQPLFTPPSVCTNGCATWNALAKDGNMANQTYVNSLWGSQTMLNSAKNNCAMPANYIGTQYISLLSPSFITSTSLTSEQLQLSFDFSFGPQCYCKGAPGNTTTIWGYCTDPRIPTPQQINVQYGNSDTNIIISYVTIDFNVTSVNLPIVEWCTTDNQCTNITGTTTFAAEPQFEQRIYSYHFVSIPTVDYDTTYTYRCIGGTAIANWSEKLTFRTRKSSPNPVRFGIVGDLGIYPFNCFTNLLNDITNENIDFFIHLGDHAYNMPMNEGARGDAYMIGFQPILSSIPWLSIMGNHEYEGSPFGGYCQFMKPPVNCEYRYLNQTAGFMVTGNASNSYTNRYYSIDIGYVHFIVLDYNYYLGLEPEEIATAQLQWLETDLIKANNNRDAVPWIIINAHVPMYCSSADVSKEKPVHALTGEPLDSSRTSSPYNGCQGTGVPIAEKLIKDIEPLMIKYGVDLHLTGHNHNYESTFPVINGTVQERSYINPTGPIHVTTGAGGAPAFSDFTDPAPFTRSQIEAWSYSKVIVYNSTTLYWEQIANNNNTVLDSWIIQQANHGPFKNKPSK